MMVGSNRNKAFEEIKDRVWARITNWKNNFLSQASKEVLLKTIVQAIPTHIMSMFLQPRKICKDITSSIAKLW